MNTDDKQIKYIVCKPEEISTLEKELEMLPLEIGRIEGTPEPNQPTEIAATFDDANEYAFIVYVDFEGMHRGSSETQDQYDDLRSAKSWEASCEERVAVGSLPDSWRREVSRRILDDIVRPIKDGVELETFEGSSDMNVRYTLEDGSKRFVRISMLYEGVL